MLNDGALLKAQQDLHRKSHKQLKLLSLMSTIPNYRGHVWTRPISQEEFPGSGTKKIGCSHVSGLLSEHLSLHGPDGFRAFPPNQFVGLNAALAPCGFLECRSYLSCHHLITSPRNPRTKLLSCGGKQL